MGILKIIIPAVLVAKLYLNSYSKLSTNFVSDEEQDALEDAKDDK